MPNLPTRNNNPGDLKDPSTGKFQQFPTAAAGFDALKNDLLFKMSGKSKVLGPNATLSQFASVWSPDSDNTAPGLMSSSTYGQKLAKQLGVTPDTPIASLASRVNDFAKAIANNEGWQAGVAHADTLPQGSPTATYTTQQFAERVKAKYPQYANLDDSDLTQRILAKYPQYQGVVSDSAAGGTQAPQLSPTQAADQESAQKYGAFFPATTGDTPIAAAGKTLGNLPSSAFNFAKGAIQTINPINTVDTLSQIPGAFSALSQESGGAIPALEATLKEIPSTAYKMLVPEAARNLISAGHGAFTGNQQEIDQGLQGAQRSIENDPFGQIAPFVFAAKGAAQALDKTGLTTGADAAFEKGMAAPTDALGAAARVAAKPLQYAFGAAKNTAEFAGRQLTGIDAETARTLEQNPNLKVGDITRESLGADIQDAIASQNPGVTPYSLGQELQGAIDRRTSALDETGGSYSDIRQTGTPLKLDKNTLGDALAQTTGLVLKKGKFSPTPQSLIDQPADVARVQRFYDAWQPYFKDGEMTADDFLTMRSKLGKIAYNDAGLKTGDMPGVASRTRGILNTAYRDQIPGLSEADADFAAQSTELKTLRRGLFDKDGQLTDAGLAKIQKATAEKPQLLQQLEGLSPGITDKIQALQAFKELGKGLVDDSGNITDAGMRRIANATNESNPLMLKRLEALKPGITDAITKYKALQEVERASNKMAVGTYARPIGVLGLGYGAISGNIPVIVGALTEMILAEPENAMKIIQTYGKTKAVVGGVLQRIGSQAKAALNAVNNAPSSPLMQTGAFGRAAQLPVGQ